jgi:glycosyltransferase involved in cell wall biosynthesis
MTAISVVIPARNDAEMLERCLLALERQTRAPDEIVVVDNGSADNTAQIARAHGAIVVSEPIAGIPRATAAGFDAATGDILARVDADSVPPEDWLARIERAFADEPELTAMTGPGDFYGGTDLSEWAGSNIYLRGYFFWMALFLGHPPLFGSNLAIRADAWTEIGPTVHRDDRRLHDDLDLSYHLTPGMTVRFDDTLRMPISARPFTTSSGLLRRIGWGFRTIWINLPGQSPWARRARRRSLSRQLALRRRRALSRRALRDRS